MTISPTNPTIATLQAILEPAWVSISRAERARHARDQSSHPGRLPEVVV